MSIRSIEFVAQRVLGEAHDGPVWPLAFASDIDGPMLVSSAVDGDSHLCLWDGASGSLKWRYNGPTIVNQGVYGVGVAGAETNSPIVVAATMSGIFRWDGLTGIQLSRGQAASGKTILGVSPVVISGRRTRIIGAAQDGLLYLFDPWTGAVVGDPLRGHGTTINVVTVVKRPHSGDVVVSGDEMGVVLRWDSQAGDWVGNPFRVEEEIVSLCPASEVIASSPVVAAADAAGDVHFWDVTTGERVGRTLSTGQGVRDMTLVALGERLGVVISGDDGVIRCWDAHTGDFCGTVTEGTSLAATSVNGETLLAIGSGDGQISLGGLSWV